MESFKINIYDKYIHTLSEHLSRHFPNVELIEASSLFNPSTIEEDMETHGFRGQSELEVLTDHYGLHKIIDAERTKSELKVFNSVVAAKGI